MAKIQNDKYYTPSVLAEYCVVKTIEIIGVSNITEYIEPSAGNGAFLNYLDKPYMAFDIEPEDNRITKADFLDIELEYKKGRCVIGNPPFGSRNLLAMKFFRKSIEIADYIAFILPISQLNNDQQMFQFDLVYSENLGVRLFSGREIYCCFNIFKRPPILHDKAIDYTLKDIALKEIRRDRKQFLPEGWSYDVGICSWGSVGKEIKYHGQYVQELYIKVNNLDLKDKVMDEIENANWEEICPTAKPGVLRLKQWQLLKYISKQISDLK